MKKFLEEFKEFISRGNVINFLIMALIIFCMVKALNKAAEKFSALYFCSGRRKIGRQTGCATMAQPKFFP